MMISLRSCQHATQNRRLLTSDLRSYSLMYLTAPFGCTITVEDPCMVLLQIELLLCRVGYTVENFFRTNRGERVCQAPLQKSLTTWQRTWSSQICCGCSRQKMTWHDKKSQNVCLLLYAIPKSLVMHTTPGIPANYVRAWTRLRFYGFIAGMTFAHCGSKHEQVHKGNLSRTANIASSFQNL